MAMPFFTPGDDPGSNFPELLRRVGLGPQDAALASAAAAGGRLDVPHATTCVALRYTDGVVMAGDRRATSGNLISHRTMEKVVQADRHSGVAIAQPKPAATMATSASEASTSSNCGARTPSRRRWRSICAPICERAEKRISG